MSDTPRTDSVEDMGDNFLQAVGSDFSRQLERELNAANDRIKRLVEIGDKMVDLMAGDESVPYDDWIVQSWDAQCKWKEVSRNH